MYLRAYHELKPRFQELATHSDNSEVRQELRLALDTFQRVQELDEKPAAWLGLVAGDRTHTEEVDIAGLAYLRDLGNQVKFSLDKPGPMGLGTRATAYAYDSQANRLEVIRYRNLQESLLSQLVNLPQQEENLTLDLERGTVVRHENWHPSTQARWGPTIFWKD